MDDDSTEQRRECRQLSTATAVTRPPPAAAEMAAIADICRVAGARVH